MPDVQTPIVVDPDPLKAQAAAIGRDIAILIGGSTAVIGFLSHGDLNGLKDWIGSASAVTFIGLLLAAGSSIYRQIKTRSDKAKMAALADSAPIGKVTK
jgi:hypothetical protein